MPGVEDDDDLLPDLPPLGDEDEEPPESAELGIDDEIAELPEDDSVDLDDSTGLEDEEPLFTLEMPPDKEGDDEAGVEGVEGVEDEGVEAIPIEGLGGEREYGWTEGADSATDETWEPDEADLPSLVPLSTEDGGEVGLDEEVDLGVEGDDAVPGLPPLGEDTDEEGPDDLAIDEDALIAEAARAFDEEAAASAQAPPAVFEPPGCTVEHLGPSDDAIVGLDLSDPPLAGGARLYRIAERCEPLEAAGLEGRAIVSVVRVDADVVVVGTRRAGPFVSSDGGATFVRSAGLDEDHVAQGFHLRREAGGARLWGCTGRGALHRSDDGGRRWVGPLLFEPALALATPAEGGVVVICAGRNAPPQLVGSVDGGERWAAVEGPPLPEGASVGEVSVAVSGERVAIASAVDGGGPFLSADGGRTWARVPGIPPTGPMALARERGGLSLYASHHREGAGVVVRYRPDGGEAGVVLDVAAQAGAHGAPERSGEDGAHRIHAVRASADGAVTVLHVATDAGLFRVRVRPDELP
jgi:hypothetical protein